MLRSFRELAAWQKASGLRRVECDPSRTFPRGERFGPRARMRRAAVAVPPSIEAGHGRGTPRDRVRFLRSPNGSSCAPATHRLPAQDPGPGQPTPMTAALEKPAGTERILPARDRSPCEKVER